ncbi:hypothetical protein SteCoe_8690 [Stentor coeruleus]|uniref:Uncharacterized protein n=1 Tax=Stentor coeruleus TaxID=5963 RepID=A0A1R2CJN7_9CILI|nr:hypothetical protein SteCoe_8690 [Stentor coeruleus]
MSGFNEELFGCFSDCPVCLFGHFIPLGPCLLQAAAVDRATGTGAIVPFILVCCLCSIGGAINRGRIREIFAIRGGFIEDCCIWYCCCSCAGCQEYREVKQRKP